MTTGGIGLRLSRAFFAQAVRPLIDARFPALRYAAARIGDGSEVLGFDTAMSADHNYGPAIQLFLADETFATEARPLMAMLDRELPDRFQDWAVRFPSHIRPADSGASQMLGSNHGVELFTIEAWQVRQLGAGRDFPSTAADWLALPEQLLLSVTAGAVFHDDIGDLTALRTRVKYLPADVWLFKLAAQWARIGEEQAFVGRTGDNGDDIGSSVIAARLARDVMRLCFLVERRYAPYPKWFGTAFAQLPSATTVGPVLKRVLTGTTWKEREAALAESYRLTAELQRERGIPGAIAPRIHQFHDRPFTVINAGEIGEALLAAIADRQLHSVVGAGAVDQWVDSTVVLANAERARAAALGLIGGTRSERAPAHRDGDI